MNLNVNENEELKLSDSITELIDKCFNELNIVMQEKEGIIEKELKMAQKWGGDINPSETMLNITKYRKKIVEDEKEESKRKIKESCKRAIANELGNMNHSEVSTGDSEKIQQLTNDFITELEGGLNIAKRNLLVLLERARSIKYYKKFY